MNLESMAMIGEFLGGIGVFVTLIYLIRETRNNTKAIKASSFHVSNASLAELNLRISENPALGSIVEKGFNASLTKKDFTDDEWSRFTFFCRSTFNSFEAMHFAYQQGLLEEELWSKRMGTCKSFVTNLPAWNQWWSEEKERAIQDASFVTAVDTAVPMENS